MVALTVSPAQATVALNGRPVGVGRFLGEVEAGPNVFDLSATGYADSQLAVRMAAGDSSNLKIDLRERTGDLRIETDPSGAEVKVDGSRRGRSPVTVRGLATGRPHRVVATLRGHGEAQRDVPAIPESLITVSLPLEAGTATLMVTTEPAGGNVRLDEGSWRKSPVTLTNVSLGSHRLAAARVGYLAADTTLTVTMESNAVELTLLPEPPGVLVVRGDRPAEIWIDNALVVAHVQNCKRELPAGAHQVKVAFADGETIDHEVVVKSGERVTYDYSKGGSPPSPGSEPR
jgi:hypothetical protein